MGVMRFAFDPANHNKSLLQRLSEQAFLVNYEGKVLPHQQVVVQDNQVAIRKADDRSAKLFFPWPIESRGDVLFSTGSLMDREEPYCLLVELARGKVSALRNQSCSWRQMGMTIPSEFFDRLEDAHESLARSVQINDDIHECSRHANDALQNAQQASDLLMASFIGQRARLLSRRFQRPPITYCCGVNFPIRHEDNFQGLCDRFDEVSLPLSWMLTEAREPEQQDARIDDAITLLTAEKLKISAGPLLDFSCAGLPDWLKQWHGDAVSLQCLVCDFVETTVSRYAHHIRKWDLAIHAEMGPQEQSWQFLTEEVRLRLLSRSLELINQIDNQLEVSLMISDPWGLYHGEGGFVLTPLAFVDMLTRARGRLSTLKLVLTEGYGINRTPPFDWLELSRLIDHWSTLGIPLQIVLAAPSSGDHIPQARHQVLPEEGHLVSSESQAEWYARVLKLVIAKESVVGIQFEHFHDGDPHRYASSGFIDVTGKTKNSFDQFAQFLTFDWLP